LYLMRIRVKLCINQNEDCWLLVVGCWLLIIMNHKQ
jgi:hypothetical protein